MYLDSLEIYDHSIGLSPFLLLDEYGSHLELKFLEYMNNCETKWIVK
jgi:hypothetical protein